MFGYAGTGKTTITRHAIAELGLGTTGRDAAASTVSGIGGVLYAAFTGKAALVMSRKGTPASTIHSLIYRVSEAAQAEIERVEEEIADLEAVVPGLGIGERTMGETRLRSLRLRLRDIHKPRFILNEQSIVRDAALIVLDEVSMVGAEMARDLLAFGKPILVLGDPGQLPPIRGEGAFTRDEPDVMLTEIHRQAGRECDHPARHPGPAGPSRSPYGEHDPDVWKMPRSSIGPEQLLMGDQVICGRNATRIRLNPAMKQAAGFEAPYPRARCAPAVRRRSSA